MEMTAYISQYSSQYYLTDNLSPDVVDRHMFLFNEETACCWGGPFEGGYAYGQLIDYTKPNRHGISRYLPTNSELDFAMEKELRKANLRYPPGKERKRKFEDIKHQYAQYTHPTALKPYRIYLMGNDDTSYSKYFSSLVAAQEEFELLKACQPLDMERDIYKNDYIFTN